MNKHIVLLFLIILGMSHFIKGQIYYSTDQNGKITYTMPEVVPVSPTAATMIKFVETPVDLKHGIASVNIPFYEIRVGDFVLPISMSYHGGGIKVDDEGGNLGQGWALQAEPSVSRSVRGLPDEISNGFKTGFFNSSNICYSYYLYNGSWYDHFTQLSWTGWKNLTSGDYDQEPDIYYYSLPTRSGRFVVSPLSYILTLFIK